MGGLRAKERDGAMDRKRGMSLRRFGLSAALLLAPSALFAQVSPMGATMPAKPPAPASTSLTLTVNGKATRFSVAELKAMPQKSLQVHNEHTKMDETYSGVALGDLLAKAGFTVDQTTHRTMLRSYLKAAGTDQYWVLYSVTEVEGSEHAGDVIVATAMDGKGLGADGELKLVSSEDKKPQRWVRNLTAIEMVAAQ
jgi:hypothetical protein